MRNKNIDKLLRDCCENKKKADALSAAGDELDYTLIGKFLEGTATTEEKEHLKKLLAKNDNAVELIELLKSVENIPAIRKRGVFAVAGQFAKRSSRSVKSMRLWEPAVLRYAACFIAAASVCVFVAVFVRRHLKTESAQSQVRLPTLRGDVQVAPTVGHDDTAAAPTRGIQVHTLEVDTGRNTPRILKVYDNAYALLIGIDDYNFERTGFPRLSQAVKDIELVRSKLKAFQFTEVLSLSNRKATRHNVLDKITELLKKAGPNGSVFIYFAGHGYAHPKKSRTGYLVPYDGTKKIDELDSRNISLATLRDLGKQLMVKHLYFALDCCFSGLMCTRGSEYTHQAPDFFYLKEITSKPVMQVLAASETQGHSIDGLFAKVFVEALEQSGMRQFVTAQEIANHVVRNVVRTARKEHDFVQVPSYAKLYQSVGEYTFVRTNDISLSYSPPKLVLARTFRLDGVDDHTRVTIADVDDNGEPEFLHTQTNTLRLIGNDGHVIDELLFDYPVEVNFVRDLNGNGCKEIAVSAMAEQTNMCIWILDSNLNIVKSYAREGKLYENRRPDGTFYREYCGMTAIDVTDIDDDYRRELIARIHMPYGLTPRELLVLDYDSGRTLWNFPTAPAVGRVSTDTDWSTGKKQILFGSHAPCNGASLPDGTDDNHTYVWLLDAAGKQLWRRQFGGLFTISSARFVDLDRDGDNEILVYMNTHYQLLKKQGKKDNGNIYVLNKRGDILNHYTNEFSVRSMCVFPDYSGAENDILVALRGGRVVKLDARLNEIRSITFTSTTGSVAEPAIKGVLNTFYGEYIVMLYREKTISDINPLSAMKVGPKQIVHFKNIHVKLLDKSTLETAYMMGISEYETDSFLLTVQSCDIDMDGQDELLISHKDRIEVYKLGK